MTCTDCIYGACEPESDDRGSFDRWMCYIEAGEPSCRSVRKKGSPPPPACDSLVGEKKAAGFNA